MRSVSVLTATSVRVAFKRLSLADTARPVSGPTILDGKVALIDIATSRRPSSSCVPSQGTSVLAIVSFRASALSLSVIDLENWNCPFGWKHSLNHDCVDRLC